MTGRVPKNPTKDGPWGKLSKFCEKNNIELIYISDLIKNFALELQNKSPRKGDNIGKLEGTSRFLLYLVHDDLFKFEH